MHRHTGVFIPGLWAAAVCLVGLLAGDQVALADQDPQANDSDAPAWLQRVEGWIKGDDKRPPRAEAPQPAGVPAERLDPDALLGKLEEALGGLPVGRHRGYVYVDDQGRRVEVSSLDEVPQKLRAYAVPLEAADKGSAPAQPDRVFRYKNKSGRDVFTNVSESVPLDQRAEAELDLSHVQLNSDLGTQINARLSAEHHKLSQSAYCQEALREAEEHRFQDLWNEYGPLIVVGAVILLFFLISPTMMKRVAVPAWVRTLRFVVPALAVAGLAAYSMMKTNRAISSFRRKAEPCMESTWSAMGDSEGGLSSKLALIKQLRSQMDVADKIPDPTRIQQQGID